ncbi:MAG: hypothetical protein ACRDY0_07985, partial [Acidimicrobiales bacterium]
GQRLALIGSASEVDLYSSSDATGNQTWLYDSASNTATHLVTAGVAGGPSPAGPARAPNPADAAGPALTPAQVARQVLAGVEGVTTLSVGPATYIAGQPAYVLTLAPKPGAAGAADSTVGRISIGIDATDGPGSGAVLQVSVTPAGGSVPALSVGFQSVHFMADGRSLPAAGFGFAPPPGTKEVTQTVGEGASGAAGLPAAGAPRVVGSAWGTVVVFHGAGPLLAGDASSAGSRVVAHRAGAVVVKPHLLGHRSVLSPGTPSPGTPSPGIPSPGIPSPGTPSPGTPSPGILGPLDALTTPVQGPSGTARLLSTSLVNILVLPDGDVAAGFVTPRALVAAVGAAG